MSPKPNSLQQHDATGPSASRSSWPRGWASYAAFAWAVAFAVPSFYWAAGGTIGLDTLGVEIQRLALTRDSGAVMAAWITGVLKLLAGVLALALVRSWGRNVPRWALLAGAWGTGALLILYGGVNLVYFTLVAVGVVPVPASVGSTAVRWYLLLWEPWFLLGGVLFCLAALSYQRRSRNERHARIEGHERTERG